MSDRHAWGDLEAEYIPACDYCDDDTDAILGIPYSLEAALDDGWVPGEAEVCLCVQHTRMLHMDIENLLEQLGDAIRPD